MKKRRENHLQDNLKLYNQRRVKMKKILILFILTVLLISCVSSNSHKCIDYKGDKRCTRYLGYEEIIWEEKK